ncbi:pescadillo homolog [Selaginella moellendorffii]|uniref:pescadillo homolog n=1 Tax=Selaginella moellendorffii TaxID=88036 RepID=UPI000D1CE57C|nr:pescadillo homolog [Selaginella moellendorffii]|eukprot:XP_024528624.1 pescadillo homolog [Selaginella moellendorffii]
MVKQVKNAVKAAKRKLHTGRRGNPGNAAKYITRNKALNRLQIKLPEFRRLCILKGIHPREPKKKFEGQNKTYYHVKDINFLLHEPLLEKSREIRAYEKKITKARAKYNADLAHRLQNNRPSFTLDHLVKERYPSFIDAVRDLEDPLTMIHLFATLPADTTHSVPFERVHSCRRLSLEWQAYVTRTHSLRKIFVSVKGIYYQVEVSGQKITYLTPHVLNQILPEDVDFRVMLTFAEFYETLLGFVNFKLYHSLGLNYPPVLDPRLEQAAAELYALMKDLAGGTTSAPLLEDASAKEDDAPVSVDEQQSLMEAENKEKRIAESQARLASLQDRLKQIEKEKEKPQDVPVQVKTEAMDVDDVIEDEDLETRTCRRLFQNLTFFLGREVPRESLLFVIRSFGGAVSWDGDGAPFPENDEVITHQIVDRPTQGHKFLSRHYVQPQWVYDCANNRILLPTEPYLLGRIPPPHLSPFVDNEAEGHVPEYADTIKRLRLAVNQQLAPLPGSESGIDEGELLVAAAARRREDLEAEKERELAAMEKSYAEDLRRELAGKSFSGEEEALADVPESEVLPPPKEDDPKDMAKMMLSRNKRNLYQAMEMSNTKKKEGVKLIKERKRKADEKERKKTRTM